ncbi:hypothetical protein Pla108_28740 [Botrimarina colliarenosi]|uniref:PEP-CTERM protein-sorting domain-containing protein n=1 Tax=Botrimarina colliarenosi TaxID=2528001 RepID=A0A5C6A8R9_9BACT|nr:hypothetical protein [Botrimarina colliarenosi]TWT95797.1 hypothetical protein Pla108_28740 [Botrimarina colliarenosi]
MNIRKLIAAKLLTTLTAVLATTSADAATITDLYNTGVDNSHVTLGNGATDSHYYVVSDSQPGVVVNSPGYPFPAWVANVNGPGGSRWVSTQRDAYGRLGSFKYQTTFTIPSYADLNSVVINGLWATDDGNSNILINGNPTNQSTLGHSSLTPFTITGASNFFHGSGNTIEFVFDNVTGPTGLRVDGISGTFVPEPTGFAAGLAGLAGIGAVRRRGR